VHILDTKIQIEIQKAKKMSKESMATIESLQRLIENVNLISKTLFVLTQGRKWLAILSHVLNLRKLEGLTDNKI
jgi:hypothetical protein